MKYYLTLLLLGVSYSLLADSSADARARADDRARDERMYQQRQEDRARDQKKYEERQQALKQHKVNL